MKANLLDQWVDLKEDFPRDIMGQLVAFIEYSKIHVIRLIQDLNKLSSTEDNFKFVEGHIQATEHLASVATDILNGGEDE
jgi:hypothetical protein